MIIRDTSWLNVTMVQVGRNGSATLIRSILHTLPPNSVRSGNFLGVHVPFMTQLHSIPCRQRRCSHRYLNHKGTLLIIVLKMIKRIKNELWFRYSQSMLFKVIVPFYPNFQESGMSHYNIIWPYKVVDWYEHYHIWHGWCSRSWLSCDGQSRRWWGNLEPGSVPGLVKRCLERALIRLKSTIFRKNCSMSL